MALVAHGFEPFVYFSVRRGLSVRRSVPAMFVRIIEIYEIVRALENARSYQCCPCPSVAALFYLFSEILSNYKFCFTVYGCE